MRDNFLAVFKKSKPNLLAASLDVNGATPKTWLRSMRRRLVGRFPASCERGFAGGETTTYPIVPKFTDIKVTLNSR